MKARGVKTPAPSAPAYGRRLMRRQQRVVLENEEGVIRGEVEPLHDLRVATRRLRVLLATFGEAFRLNEALHLERRLNELQKKLGPARDADVLIRILTSPPFVGRLETQPNYVRVLTKLKVNRKRNRQKAVRILRSRSYHRLNTDLDAFIRNGLTPRRKPVPSVAKLGAGAIRNALTRVDKHARIPKTFPADKAHKLRIACRRTRYLAEFFNPVLGPEVGKLAKRLRGLQDVLGDIHDIDVLITAIRTEYSLPPVAVLSELREERKKLMGKYVKAWSRLSDFRKRAKVKKVLKR